MSVFGDHYADHYDEFYAQKDYRAECDLVEEAWRRHAASDGRHLLDVGCGTGGHAVELARRGWSVCGVDRSAAMLRRAAAKSSSVRFLEGDAQTFDAGARFDVAVMMFAVIGYFDDPAAALANVRRHVVDGGLLMFDCWYGPAVLAQKPGDRVLTVGGTSRHAHGALDPARRLVTVEYRLVDDLGESTESHTMRYFFADELRSLLADASFDLLALSAFPSLDAPLTDETWNAFAVARARA